MVMEISGRKIFGFDRLDARALSVVASYHSLPLLDQSVDVVIFDPPFQPQTSDGSDGVVGKRFTKISGGISAVEADVRRGLRECWRVARLGLIVKVQDYIHDHKPVWMSRWVWDELGDPYDFCTLRAVNKLQAKTGSGSYRFVVIIPRFGSIGGNRFVD